MGLTITEKIYARHTAAGAARAGDFVDLRPDVVLLNDVSGPVAIPPFEAMGGGRVFKPESIVLVADHFAPAKDVRSAEQIKLLREFGIRHGIDRFFHPGNGGIEHAVLAEQGLVYPGAVVIGGDSHTCTAGALNAVGIGFGSTDLAAALALGEIWVRVPDTIRIDLFGCLSRFVTGKDVILHLIRQLGSDGALGASLEFGGPGLTELNVDERMAIANMAVEASAETCAFEPDAATETYCAKQGASGWASTWPDKDAVYTRRIAMDLRVVEPTIAAPPSPANGRSLSELAGTPVDQVYIGNCSNGTLTDLRQAAAILQGHRVSPAVRMIVVPATQAIYRAALKEGLILTITEAGAAVSMPTCGACFGGHMGILAKGETAIATTNRNFRGRMGDPESKVYLANAAVAAAAAVRGGIVHPDEIVGDAR